MFVSDGNPLRNRPNNAHALLEHSPPRLRRGYIVNLDLKVGLEQNVGIVQC